MVFVTFDAGAAVAETATAAHAGPSAHLPQQSALDNELEKQSGEIKRGMSSLCRHGPKGMCDYCRPIEPYSAEYREEHGIKHESFYAHLRKINAATNKPELAHSFIPPLSEERYTVLPHCSSGHKPWPRGICSKCQPSAITLSLQEFRMVDHVEFADARMVNEFIEYWRKSGRQRLGYMYGRFEAYTAVPLGVKAVVEAIYEPPQVTDEDGLQMQENYLGSELDLQVDQVAKACGLEKVGVIFTDLLDIRAAGSQAAANGGSVVCKRHIKSFFLSSLEAQFAGLHQHRFPMYTKWSETGRFGSRFVTCVVSGNTDNEIDIAAYQVSNAGVGMVAADLIEPSVDPNFMLVKQEEETRYVPEIFYSKINEYGRQVKENAKPAFPMEYLLVTLTHGFPDRANPMFRASVPFPTEHRADMGVSQDMNALSRTLHLRENDTAHGAATDRSLYDVSDFHLLAYVSSLGILPSDDMQLLARVASSHDVSAAQDLVARPAWQTLLEIVRQST